MLSQPLLQIAVDLEAVVSRVGHGHVSVRRQRQTLRAVKRVARRVDVRQEGARAVENLTGTNDHNISWRRGRRNLDFLGGGGFGFRPFFLGSMTT